MNVAEISATSNQLLSGNNTCLIFNISFDRSLIWASNKSAQSMKPPHDGTGAQLKWAKIQTFEQHNFQKLPKK